MQVAVVAGGRMIAFVNDSKKYLIYIFLEIAVGASD